ncbi:hypothetical protein QG37_05084 [Candidozyma auris]|nr:hypothetical protein QG37_05084 [[Candida] auris]
MEQRSAASHWSRKGLSGCSANLFTAKFSEIPPLRLLNVTRTPLKMSFDTLHKKTPTLVSTVMIQEIAVARN